MLVNLVHPVHVHHLPRGGRKPRASLVADVVPAELVPVADGAMEPVRVEGLAARALSPHAPVPEALFLHEGAAWLRLDGFGGAYAPDRFLAWLGGDPGADGEFNHLNMGYQGTPLVAQTVHVEGGSMHRQFDGRDRGGAFEDHAQRRILRDGRGKGGARAAAFARAEFRVGTEAVYARYRPSAAVHDTGNRAGRRLVARNNPMLGVRGDAPVNPWRLALGEASWDGAVGGGEAVAALLDLLPPGEGVGDAHDLTRLANWLAVKLRRYVTARPPSYYAYARDERRRARVAAAAEALVPYEEAGATGAIGPAEAGEVLRRAAEAIEAFAGALGMASGPEVGGLAGVARHIRAHALARLDPGPAALPEEDVAGIASLARSG